MIKAFLVYLKIHFIVSLLFCFVGNIQGILIGIPLYGVIQSWVLALAIKKEVWENYPYVHKSDVVLASFFMVVFTISIILSILYMFCRNCFPSLAILVLMCSILAYGEP